MACIREQRKAIKLKIWSSAERLINLHIGSILACIKH